VKYENTKEYPCDKFRRMCGMKRKAVEIPNAKHAVEAALQEISRRKPNAKNRVDPVVERAVLDFAHEQPAYGQLRVSNELRKREVFVSPGGMRSIWLRHDLATFKGRLKALETRMVQEGIVLTESQLAAMERAREEKEAHGETETEHPGYLGAQDTYYVGNIKGVGHIWSLPDYVNIVKRPYPI